jgi:hypothetical protein
MKTKKFIESEYFGLEEVHAFNTFLKSLPQADINPKLAQEIFDLISVHPSYEDITKYVPGSDKYNRIFQEDSAYNIAKAKLQAYNYSKELLIEECYPDYIYLYKHSITYKMETCDIDYGWDGEEEYITSSGPYEVDVTQFFYTTGFSKSEIVFDPTTISLPYINKAKASDSDIIQQYIDLHGRTTKRLHVYEECYKRGWDTHTFLQVFDYQDITFYTTFLNDDYIEVSDNITGKRYGNLEIEDLMEQYLVAKTKKYVYDDRYVEYPSYQSYIRFLEKLGTVYSEVPVNSH